MALPSSRSGVALGVLGGRVMKALIDTVLFDFDGTLVDTALDFARMRREVLDLANLHGAVPPEGLHILEIIAHVQRQLAARGPKAARSFVQQAESILTRIEIEGADRAQPLPGAQETLTELREHGLSVGIVTRNCRRAVERILARLPLPHDLLLTRDDVAQVKPDPGHLLEALSRLGSRPERAVMVGDHPMDILAGRKAGMRTAAIASSRPASDFADVCPDLVIESIAQLLTILPQAANLRDGERQEGRTSWPRKSP